MSSSGWVYSYSYENYSRSGKTEVFTKKHYGHTDYSYSYIPYPWSYETSVGDTDVLIPDNAETGDKNYSYSYYRPDLDYFTAYGNVWGSYYSSESYGSYGYGYRDYTFESVGDAWTWSYSYGNTNVLTSYNPLQGKVETSYSTGPWYGKKLAYSYGYSYSYA